ncbi:g10710 [Coccomyxa viridis]|uniref:G10710 protein n=1 Tax=Coccomyxa viridis TaxID=1274662 RepID=A0ABP1G8Q8_9CHLO
MHRGPCIHRPRSGALHQGYGWQQLKPPLLWHGLCTGRRDEEEQKLEPAQLRVAQSASSMVPPLPLTLGTLKEKQAYDRELRTVTVAITANIVIFVAKLVTYILSGSSAMLAETVHSVVDTLNQALLRVGIVRSKRAPTKTHPYGYMKDKFVWSLVSAVGIFCLGAGVTCAHGVSSLMSPPPHLEHMGYSLAVLGVSFVVEGYSLLVATRSVLQGAQAMSMTFWEYIRRGMDPTTVAVMMEDGAAVTGLLIAGASTCMVHLTGNAVYDAVGSITIGGLLGCTAIFLIQQNRSLLLGRAMNNRDMQKVLLHLRKDPVVRAVYDAKSEEIGPNIFRFKAEIEFNGERIVEHHMERMGGKEQLLEQMYSAMATRRDETVDLALRSYGRDMVGALGAEVDRLETEIQQVMPSIRHIDLETDRGRHDKRSLNQGFYSIPFDPLKTMPC